MFNTEKFKSAQFTVRTKEVPVPELKDFFPEGTENPVWIVRGMNGTENVLVEQESSTNEIKLSFIDAIAAIKAKVTEETKSELIEAVRDVTGIYSSETPELLVKRKKMLELCSISPVCDETTAIKLAEVFPTTFFKLTTAIYDLTGRGQEMGKPKPSSKKKASKEP